VRRFQVGIAVGGRYELVEFVAAGGMGDVWRARDQVLDRVVAVKVMRPDMLAESVFAQRFREEAQLTAGLSHANIATLYDFGEHERIAYLVMEFVDGRTLSKTIQEEAPLDPDRVRSVLAQVGLALGAAHQAGIVHRDVKPANVIVTDDGTVNLTDFGIARATDASGLTRTGETMGTPHYLSPEQALGRQATGASDLYALGVVGHEMLTGRRPFDRGTPVATALAHVSEPMPTLPSSLPADLIRVITECLSKEPEDRPTSGHDIAIMLGLNRVETPLTPTGLATVPAASAAAATSGNLAIALDPRTRLVDLLAKRRARICVLSSKSATIAESLAGLGHTVVGITADEDMAHDLTERQPGVTWHASELRSLSRALLSQPAGFDVILWSEGAVLDLPPAERPSAMWAIAGLCSARGRVIVEFALEPDYDQARFRDDFLTAGMVPDMVVSSWDLRPFTPESGTSITILSRR
jgi:serine/threonine-protein kinase